MKIIGTVFIICFIVGQSSAGSLINCFITSDTTIKLSGVLKLRKYTNANGRMEKQPVLELTQKICVNEDPFGGPVKDISNVQIIFLPSKFKNGYQMFISKHVYIIGQLFYPQSSHHFTKILLEAYCLVEQNPKTGK